MQPLSRDQQLWLDQAMSSAASAVQLEVMPLPPAHLQALYDAVLEDYWDNDRVIESVGAAFGACLEARGEYEWMFVQDAYGDDIVLAARGFDIFLSPFSMIAKRIEARESWDIAALCQSAHKSVQDRIRSGDVDTR